MDKKFQDEYLKAFNGEEEEAMMVSDDAAEGATEATGTAVKIDAEKAVADAAEENGILPAEGLPTEGVLPEKEVPMEPMGEPAGEEGPAMEDGEMSPEDIQRQKSWEGRLRKREEELAAREAAASNAPAVSGDAAAAIAQLTEDFGAEFVKMIVAIAAGEANKVAAENVGGVSQTIDNLISDMQTAFRSMHYSAIADAHSDFMEVAQSPKFVEWLESLPDEQRVQKEAIVEGGTAGQVIKLLNEYKDWCKQKDGAQAESDDYALDAASGVRSSSPVSLPSKANLNPDDEYLAAWNSM